MIQSKITRSTATRFGLTLSIVLSLSFQGPLSVQAQSSQSDATSLKDSTATKGSTEEKSKKWDISEHRAPTKVLEKTISEGTWMNVDVSPNGQEIVFDLMGDLYVIPIGGGKAQPLRTGPAFEIQPRFSPDGEWISFTSDAGGGDNIWVMRRDGSEARQVTNETFRLLNNASWAEDGQYLIARKHFTSTRSLGSGEIWMYHLYGGKNGKPTTSGGTGMQLVKKPNEQQDLGQPVASADGRYVYYSRDVYPGGFFQYNKDPNSQIYAIFRFDRQTGEVERVTGGPGGAISPTPSPDGKKLAFVRRVRTKSVLYIRDLESGIEKPVFDELSKDQQEAWAIFGPYTNLSWTPDSRDLVFWAKGKLHRLNTETLTTSDIPFEADIRHEIAEPVLFQVDPAPDSFAAKGIRHAVSSPDGSRLVFSADGKLWQKTMPNGTPERVTRSEEFEFEPSFSADGNKLVYVSWTDQGMGAVKVLDLTSRRATPKAITTEKGIYREPSFSPDGSQVVFRRESGNTQQGFAFTLHAGIYTIPSNGQSGLKESVLISKNGSEPRFNTSGDRIFYKGGGYLSATYESVDLNGGDRQVHFTSRYANNFVPSPDNKWIAFNELFKVYIAPFPKTGLELDLNANTSAIPVAQVAEDAGLSLHWMGNSGALRWTLGEKVYDVLLDDAFAFLGGEVDSSLPLAIKAGTDIGLVLTSDKPSGLIAFTNARVITMDQEGGFPVIDNGTVLVRENRIEAVGEASEVQIPSDAFVVDLDGKSIMPGIIDVHAHIGNFRNGLSPQQQWEYYANLAYGVTTAHDPSTDSEMIFSHAELIRSGTMVGPRLFSTGRILYGAEGDFKAVVNNLDDARSAVERTQAMGGISVKSYNQPRRDQRQQVLQASRDLGVMVYPEGGSTFYHNMTMILDGHTGIEHNIPIYPAYDDVISLWGLSGVGYTPTLVVNYGSMSGEYYWYQKTNVWEKERLLTFTPRTIVDSRSRHRVMIPDEEYDNGHILSASLAKDLLRAGVNVNLGAHGQLQGLGAHWELWMFEQGGMSPMEALQVATLNGARYLGMDQDLGSIEVGKLADLIVIDGNPLADIRQTENVVYTMVNGRLFDSATMNELGQQTRERKAFWWEMEGVDSEFDWQALSRSAGEIQCSCHP